ncbi:SPASM domain-containing protein [Methanosarcina spelaei]|nr:SPASM domain-containing protein [Methanosarcina spelaei]
MIDFIVSNGIKVSTSLDGIETVHNKYRKLPGSDGSYIKVLDNINRLRRVGVNVGAMAVITADSLTDPEAIVDNFANLGIYPFVINPVFSSGRATNSWNILGIDPNMYSQFWKRLAKRCLEYQSQNIPIWDSSFELLLRKVILAQEPEYLDLMSPCGCIHGQIAYDLQGNVYPCNDARCDQKVILGNVMENSFKDVSECKEALKIKDASIINSERCGLCAYRPWCGRCPISNKLLFGKYDVPSEMTYNCRIWKGLFDKFFELIFEDMNKITMAASLVRQYDITRRS